MTKNSSKLEEHMKFVSNTYRDVQGDKFTQVTASCKCGRGGWIRLPHHPTESLLNDRIIEARIDELERYTHKVYSRPMSEMQAAYFKGRISELKAKKNEKS